MKSKSLIVVICLVCGFLFWGAMNTTGFCWSQGQYLSDEEIFKGVVKIKFLESKFLRLTDIQRRSGDKNIQKHIKYNSVKEFFKINPDCCAFYYSWRDRTPRIDMGAKKRTPSYFHKFFGSAWRAMAIKYKVFYLDHEGFKKFVTYGFSTWTNACGVPAHVPLKYIIG